MLFARNSVYTCPLLLCECHFSFCQERGKYQSDVHRDTILISESSERNVSTRCVCPSPPRI
jgi:hypothetical protein